MKHLLLILLFLFPLLFFLLLFFLLLLLFLLPRRLHYRRSDPVQIPLSILRNPTSAIVRLLKDTDLLKGLADLALHGCRAVGVVRGAVASSLTSAVEFCECADSDVFAEVDVSCDGG